MKPHEDPVSRKLERLLDAAREACPPVPPPSPWFEQRMLQRLRSDGAPSLGAFEGVLIFRMLGFAAAFAFVCVCLPLFQTSNPYRDTLNLANSAAQIGQLP
jgi:hypothetical protein